MYDKSKLRVNTSLPVKANLFQFMLRLKLPNTELQTGKC